MQKEIYSSCAKIGQFQNAGPSLQYGNLQVFLSIEFYVKQVLVKLESQTSITNYKQFAKVENSPKTGCVSF